MGREVQAGFGDGWRVSGPILGSKAFAAKVLSDIASMDKSAVSTVSASDVIVTTPPRLDRLIGVTCAVVGLEQWEFEQQPKRRAPALARRIVTYLWVQRYKQPQIALAKRLCVSTGAVSRWYSKAVREVIELESLCDEVVLNLPEEKGRIKGKTGHGTRYNLQLEQD